MTAEKLVVVLAITLGLLIGFVDAWVDYLVFYDQPFMELLITNVPRHEVYIRFVILASCTVFGLVVARVMAQRRRSENEMQRLASIVEATTDFVGICDPQRRPIYINRAGRVMLGLGDQPFAHRRVSDFHTPEGHRLLEDEAFPAAIRGGIWSGENTLLTTDGREVPVSQLVLSHKSETGQLEYLSTVARDISDMVQAQRALRDSEEKYRGIAERSFDVIFMADLAGTLTYVSPAVEDVFYYTPGEIVGRHFTHFLVESEASRVSELFNQWRHGGDPGPVEVTVTRKDGSLAFVELNSASVTDCEKRIGIQGIIRDVTQRREAELALKDREATLSSIFRAAPAGIGLLVDGVLTQVNERICEMVGYPREALIGQSETMLYPTRQEYQRVIQATRSPAASGKTHSIQTRWSGKDGRIIDILLHTTPLDLDDPSAGITFTALDNTARKQAESQYQMLFETMLDGFALHEMIFDDGGKPIDYRYLSVNPAFERLTGLSAEVVLGNTVREVLPDIEDHWIEFFGRVATTGEPGRFENVAAPLGKQFEVVAFRPRPGQFACVFQDVTERKQIEEALRESADFARSTLNGLSSHIAIVNENGVIEAVNNAWREFAAGNPPIVRNACEGANYLSVCDNAKGASSRIAAEFGQAIRDVLAGRRDEFHREYPCHAPNEQRWFIGRVTRFPEGKSPRAVIAHENITERKRAEEILHVQSQLAQTLSVATSLDRAIPYCVDAAMRATGMDCGGAYLVDSATGGLELRHARGLSYGFVSAASHHNADSRHAELVMNGQPVYLSPTDLQVLFDGAQIREGLRSLALAPLSHEGRVLGCLIVGSHGREAFPESARRSFESISAQVAGAIARMQAEERLRDMETQLAHVGRLSAMGELVAGIAHELNQPLYSILNFSKACRNALAVDKDQLNLDDVREWCEEIAGSAQHAGAIVTQLRSFSRRTEAKRRPTELDEIIDESIALVGFEARRRRIDVKLQRCSDSVSVMVDRTQILQVMVNLLRNAYEAMEDSRITRRTVTVQTDAFPDAIQVTVADTGLGLPTEDGHEIFDAFVTTKPDGLGMGLAISRTIVEAHGGRLGAVANPEGGAIFRFSLPTVGKGRADAE